MKTKKTNEGRKNTSATIIDFAAYRAAKAVTPVEGAPYGLKLGKRRQVTQDHWMTDAEATTAFLKAWGEDREGMKARGFGCSWEYEPDGHRYAQFWTQRDGRATTPPPDYATYLAEHLALRDFLAEMQRKPIARK
jgi:hypothetical protein